MTTPDDDDSGEEPRAKDLVDRILADEPATPHRRDVPVDYPNPVFGFALPFVRTGPDGRPLSPVRPPTLVIVALAVALAVVWVASELWG